MHSKKKKAKRSIYAFTSFARRKRMHFFHPFFFFKKKIERTALRIAFFSTHLRAERIQRKKKRTDAHSFGKKTLVKSGGKKSMNVLPFFLRAAKRSFFSIFFRRKKKRVNADLRFLFFEEKKCVNFFFFAKKKDALEGARVVQQREVERDLGFFIS